MARKKEKKLTPARPQLGDNVEILSAGEVLESAITDTLETNYMPYAMSVIVSRALPEIDGFKPAHRKLLYTMYSLFIKVEVIIHIPIKSAVLIIPQGLPEWREIISLLLKILDIFHDKL